MDKSIAICIPTVGLLHWRFAADLMGLQLFCNTNVYWQPRTMIDTARNLLAQRALDNVTVSHIFMVDDDMTFSGDFLKRLFDHDVDIVSGLAFKRTPDYHPCVYEKRGDDHFPILPEVFREIDACGTGGILIKREVFEKIPYPWFETWYDKEHKDKRHFSVDLDFSMKAKKAGFKIFVDPAADMGHIGEAPIVTKQTFLNLAKQQYDDAKQEK